MQGARGRERLRRAAHAGAAVALGRRSKALGKHLRLHPVLVVWGQFDEQVRPWEGMLASTFSDQDADMDGDGYGVKYEHVAIPPSILLSFSPWRGGAPARRADAGAAVHGRRRRAAARPRRGRGAHRPRRRAGRALQAHRRRRRAPAPRRARRARRWSRRWARGGSTPRTRSGSPTSRARSGDLDGFMRDADACGWGAGQAQTVSFHIMGSARMGGSPADSVCDPTGQVWTRPASTCSTARRSRPRPASTRWSRSRRSRT